MYAIVESGGEQIKVSAGDTVSVEKVAGDVNSDIVMDRVLMIEKDGAVVVGKPYIAGAKVTAEILETAKGDKVLVFGPRPKKSLRKLRGHRQFYTKLKIKDIIGG
jgi:large subunit ribosomal protein L21